ncbi:MAG: preprotein translocase subunit SecE [Planctomycetota bacterium]
MAFGIRKAGQGYWVRVLSAVFWGGIVLAGAAWAAGQASTVPLPVQSFIIYLQATEGELAAGETVTLTRENDQGSGRETVTTALVDRFEPGANRSATIEISGFTSTADDVTRADLIQAGDGAGEGAFEATVRNMEDVPVFPQLYLQGGAAGVVILIGAFLLYWFHAASRKGTEFLIATDNEMKKVNWSSPREIRGSTIVVIVAAFLIAGILYAIDNVFGAFFRWIGVLDI